MVVSELGGALSVLPVLPGGEVSVACEGSCGEMLGDVAVLVDGASRALVGVSSTGSGAEQKMSAAPWSSCSWRARL